MLSLFMKNNTFENFISEDLKKFDFKYETYFQIRLLDHLDLMMSCAQTERTLKSQRARKIKMSQRSKRSIRTYAQYLNMFTCLQN